MAANLVTGKNRLFLKFCSGGITEWQTVIAFGHLSLIQRFTPTLLPALKHKDDEIQRV